MLQACQTQEQIQLCTKHPQDSRAYVKIESVTQITLAGVKIRTKIETLRKHGLNTVQTSQNVAAPYEGVTSTKSSCRIGRQNTPYTTLPWAV